MSRILCVHGLGGTAATMGPLVDALGALGHQTHAITLPGHGTIADDLVALTWHDWLAAVADCCASESIDVIVGQSMGGSLALAVGAHSGCRAIVAINPPPPDPDAIDGLEWRLSRGHDWIDGPALGALPDGSSEPGYTRLPIAALLQMATGIDATDLGAVHVPVLIVSSALDEVVDPTSAAAVADAIGSPVERLELVHSGHVATLGPEVLSLARSIDTFVHRSLG